LKLEHGATQGQFRARAPAIIAELNFEALVTQLVDNGPQTPTHQAVVVYINQERDDVEHGD
jgi:hypothetical protein